MSRTVHIEESVQIADPPAVVWEAIADYSLDREWRNGLLEMAPDPPGPPAVGTKVHEVVQNVRPRICRRHGGHRPVDPGRSYRFEGSGDDRWPARLPHGGRPTRPGTGRGVHL